MPLPKDLQDVGEQELFSATSGCVSGSLNDRLALQSSSSLPLLEL